MRKGTIALEEMLKFIKEEAKALEQCENVRGTTRNQEDETQQAARKPIYQHRSTAAALTTIVPRSGCPFCGIISHKPQQCDLSVNKRREVIAEKGACFLCFHPGHSASECRNPNMKHCPICKKRHHVTLCNGREKAIQSSSVNIGNARESPVLLQTAVIWVKGTSGKAKVRCLLDLGAHKTFITQRLAKEIGLKRGDEKTLRMSGFGGGEVTTYMKGIVEVSAANQEGKTIGYA